MLKWSKDASHNKLLKSMDDEHQDCLKDKECKFKKQNYVHNESFVQNVFIDKLRLFTSR